MVGTIDAGPASRHATTSGYGSRPAGPVSRIHEAPYHSGGRVSRIVLFRRSGPTRLETRTKESDMGASSRVANPSAQRNRDSLSPLPGAWLAARCSSVQCLARALMSGPERW